MQVPLIDGGAEVKSYQLYRDVGNPQFFQLQMMMMMMMMMMMLVVVMMMMMMMMMFFLPFSCLLLFVSRFLATYRLQGR